MNGIILRIALRNLRVHLVRTIIVGLLLILGTFLVVVGNASIDAVQAGMRKSVIQSIAGHVQVYSADGKDELELYRSIAMGVPDIGVLDPFSKVRDVLMGIEGVRAVVPMGVDRSMVVGKAILDVKLVELRAAVADGRTADIPPLVAHIRKIALGLSANLDKLEVLSGSSDEARKQRAAIERVNSEAFWSGFDADPYAALEFLDNQVAPLGVGSGFYFLMYLGTDLQAFAKHFDLFEMVEGQLPPPGERGFVFNVHNYEKFIKHKTARRLDTIKRARDEEMRRIESDDSLQRMAERAAKQSHIVTDELAPADAAAIAPALAAEVGLPVGDFDALMKAFLTLDDANFDRRYALFYEHIAPRIRLHRFEIGDTLTLYSTDLQRSVNVKIWGVFRFKGLERSQLSGSHHLMDMMTFRELYGLGRQVDPAELAALNKRANVEDVARDDAEAALFSGDDLIDDAGSDSFDEFDDNDLSGARRAAEAARAKPFTQAELEGGPVLNAAVFLDDVARIPEVVRAIPEVGAAAGLSLKAKDWRDASGIVGQLTAAIDYVFPITIIIIFLVAMLIITTSLVMSTLDRVKEIGAMRAMGAQRWFVVRLLVTEAGATAFIFGFIGAGIGALLVLGLGSSGVPATTELQYFLFGGTSLHPELQASHLVAALIAIVATTTFAVLVPAILAALVKPVTAMQASDA